MLTDFFVWIACSTTVNVAISFGGQSWSISPADFLMAQISVNQCVGSIFVLTGSSFGPGWVVGDTFLKNVYSVFRANPPSIGFAALAPGVESSVTENGVPTPTIGLASVSVSVTGSSRSRPTSQNVALPSGNPHLASLFFVAMSPFLFYLL
jgi:cathepsin D